MGAFVVRRWMFRIWTEAGRPPVSETNDGRAEGRTGAGAPDSDTGAGEALTLEGKLDRLSEIVSMLEAEELELDRALALFEEGVHHIRDAEELLSRAELQVEELVGDGEEANTRPFEGGEGDSGE